MPRTVADQAWRVNAFQNATGEPAEVAQRYLEAEEWMVMDALASYGADRRAAQARTAAAVERAARPAHHTAG